MEMKEKTCCFTGHRDIPKKLYPKIKKRLSHEIKRLISQGVLYFGCGGAQGFDTLCAQMVLKLKRKYPGVKLILVLPFPGQADLWQAGDVRRYESIKRRADKVVMVCEQYQPGCYHKRNRHLVDNSGHCICYLTRVSGGTAYTVAYARRQGCSVTNLAGQ